MSEVRLQQTCVSSETFLRLSSCRIKQHVLCSRKKKKKNQSSPAEHHSRLCSIVTSDFGWVMSALSSTLVSPACQNWAGDFFFFSRRGGRCKKRARSEKKHPPGFPSQRGRSLLRVWDKMTKKEVRIKCDKVQNVTWLQQNVEEVGVTVNSTVRQSWDYLSPWTTVSPETLPEVRISGRRNLSDPEFAIQCGLPHHQHWDIPGALHFIVGHLKSRANSVEQNVVVMHIL